MLTTPPLFLLSLFSFASFFLLPPPLLLLLLSRSLSPILAVSISQLFCFARRISRRLGPSVLPSIPPWGKFFAASSPWLPTINNPPSISSHATNLPRTVRFLLSGPLSFVDSSPAVSTRRILLHRDLASFSNLRRVFGRLFVAPKFSPLEPHYI